VVTLVDVNVLVYAMRREAPRHDEARAVLARALVASRPLGVLDETLAAVIRIGTHPRLWTSPVAGREALDFCERVRSAPATVILRPDDRCWAHFSALAQTLDLRGNDVPDAWLAAMAMAHHGRLLTYDAGFRRFPGLQLDLLGADGAP
jgi:toxin-antitoxin system PIN domain toxin